jgi:type IX secretion system PorP/SprF family membrane protein
MIKRIIVVSLFISLTAKVFAQQDPMYSQYVFNGMLINPAYAGTREVINAVALYRNQWVNVPGAPKTGVFSIDSPVRNQKVGVGMNLVVDKIGVTSHTGFAGIYSYKLYFNKSTLSFGLQGGVGFYNSNNTEVQLGDGTAVDPAFMTDYHMVLPNFSIGTYYHSDRFYAGFSVMDILGNTIQGKLYPNVSNDLSINIVSHFFLTSGYLFDLTPNVRFQPSFLLKYVAGAPVEGDITAIVSFYDLLSFGVSWRSNASLDALTQVKINQSLSLGYSYEYTTNELTSFTSGSHEIVLRYQLAGRNQRFVSPRYF